MDNVLIVVDDLKAVTALFVELGLELEGEMTVEGRWVDRVVGLDGVRNDIAMMRTLDGHGRLELVKFHRPTAISAERPGGHHRRAGRADRLKRSTYFRSRTRRLSCWLHFVNSPGQQDAIPSH